jgi:signal transduction histidine kinase
LLPCAHRRKLATGVVAIAAAPLFDEMTMEFPRATNWKVLLSPLAIAAYLAIVVVALGTLSQPGSEAVSTAGAVAALGVFTLGFALLLLRGDCASRPHSAAMLGAMLLSAFVMFWRGPVGVSGILFVLWASVLAARVQGRRLLLILVAVNLAMLALLRWHSQLAWSAALSYALGFASFQSFATLVMTMTVRAERDRDQLAQVNADLLATRSLLAESARDSERLRLSRELHDIAGHKLTALKLNLAALARDPRWQGDDAVRLCAQLADELLADIRGVVLQMRLHDGLDLRQAIGSLAAPFPRPRVHLELADDARAADLEQAEALLRTMQEALTNAARHSNAENLWVVLRRERDGIALDIRDDGRGSGELHFGNGLSGMRERLRAIGGALQVERGDGGGVRLLARLPVPA